MEMSNEQKKKLEELEIRHGKYLNISTWDKVVFVEYTFGVIGIELDGYSHM